MVQSDSPGRTSAIQDVTGRKSERVLRWRRIEGRNAVGKWPVERISEVEDHPLKPARVAQEGIAKISALKQIAQRAAGTHQALEIRFVDGARGDRDSVDDGIG